MSELAIPVVGARWPRDVLLVKGPDAAAYLQGQLSADVEALEIGQSALALLLAPSGKMEALLRVWRTDETQFVLDTDAGHGPAVATRLARFLLRTDATISQLDWGAVALRGDGATAVDVDDSGAELMGLGLWPAVEGLDLLGPDVRLPDSAEPADVELLEVLRIRAGWPVQGAEITESTIPAEIGSWLITAAVSFDKGCYVGQELTARVHSRGGNAPRRLSFLSFESQSTAAQRIVPGAKLFVQGSAKGVRPDAVVTSAATDPRSGERVALAFVARAVSDEGELFPEIPDLGSPGGEEVKLSGGEEAGSP